MVIVNYHLQLNFNKYIHVCNVHDFKYCSTYYTYLSELQITACIYL